jgi:Lrp/AsnC family transcriptional regulator
MRKKLTSGPDPQANRSSGVSNGSSPAQVTAGQHEAEARAVDSLDRIDLKILAVLQENGALSAAEVAEAVGLSQSPCWRRIQRLKEEGYISKIVALLDRRKLDLSAQLFVQVKVSRNDMHNLREFSRAIRAFPEVMECHVILGVYDFLLRVIAPDMEAYQKFFSEKLSQIPNIREVNSFVAVMEVKSTTALPLEGLISS